MHKKNMSSKRPSTKGKAAPTTSRREMENALLLAHASCDVSGGSCIATDSVTKAICRFWSGLETDARRSLTSEKKHVVLQTLRKKHLHTRNCPCCQHSKARPVYAHKYPILFILAPYPAVLGSFSWRCRFFPSKMCENAPTIF
jgi:hypothetical protein